MKTFKKIKSFDFYKNNVFLNFLSFYLFLQLVVSSSYANQEIQQLDLGVIDSMIQKLEYALGPIENIQQDPSEMIKLQGSLLKLADLYSDKSRALLQNSKESELKSNLSLSKKQNQKALGVYLSLLKFKNEPNTEGYIRLQISQQYLALEENQKAFQVLIGFTKSPSFTKIERQTKDELNYRLGQLFQAQGQNQEALKHYQYVTSSDQYSLAIQSLYQTAWCEFNLARPQNTFKILLQVAQKENNQNYNYYTADDILTDLINVGTLSSPVDEILKAIQLLSSSQQTTLWAQKLISQLIEKSRFNEALFVNSKYKNDFEKNNQSFEYSLNELNIHLLKSQKKQVQTSYLELTKNDKNTKMNDDQKEILLKEIDQKIRRWVQEENVTYSVELIETLKIHVQYRPDLNLSQFVSQNLKKQSKPEQAYWFFEKTFETYEKSSVQQKNKLKNLEDFLIAKIEMAENLSQINYRKQSYEQYLKYYPIGKVSSESRYQLAYIHYQQKNWNKALEELEKYAQNTNEKRNLRLMAAHLELDTLAQLNDKLNITKKAQIYSQMFKEDYLKFNEIEFITLQNILFDKKFNNFDISIKKNVLIRMSDLTLGSSFEKQLRSTQTQENIKQILYLLEQNRLFNELEMIAQKIIQRKAIKPQIQSWAHASLVSVYENKGQYKTALAHLEKELSLRKAEQKDLIQKSVFEELAGRSPLKTYEQIISNSKNLSEKLTWSMTYFEKAENKLVAYKKYSSLLKQDKNFYQKVLIVVWAHHVQKNLNTTLAQEIKKQAHPQSLIHLVSQIEQLNKVEKRFLNYKFSAKNPEKWGFVFKKHEEIIKELLAESNKTRNKQNTLIQILNLSKALQIKKDSLTDFNQLPAPNGLNISQKNEFLKARSQKLEPEFKWLKENLVQLEYLENEWKKKAELENIEATFISLDETTYNWTKQLFTKVFAHSQVISTEKWFERTSQSRRKRASLQLSSRRTLYEEPNNINTLRNSSMALMGPENGPIVAYLQARLNELKTTSP